MKKGDKQKISILEKIFMYNKKLFFEKIQQQQKNRNTRQSKAFNNIWLLH